MIIGRVAVAASPPPLTSSSPTRSEAAVDSSIDAGRRTLSHLTPSDLQFIAATTGERVDPHSGGASLFAVTIAMQRESSALPAGQPITLDSFEGLLGALQAQEADDRTRTLLTDRQVEAARSFLDQKGGRARTDVRI